MVIRNLTDASKSLIFTGCLAKVTAVKYSPDGNTLAVGQENGKVALVSYSEEKKEFTVKKEHIMLMGEVQAISFSEDGKQLVAVGQGKDFMAKCVMTESGTKQGDMFGPTKTLISVDISKSKRIAMSGENYDLYVFDGFPAKQFKTVRNHTNFVNKVKFNSDGTRLVTVSSDK